MMCCAGYAAGMSIFAQPAAGKKKELSGNVLILVNGRAIEHLSGLDTPLKGSDEVAIFPKMAGG